MRALLIALSAVMASLCSPVLAQETRMGEEGYESPAATLDQMDWLEGQWHGDGIGGAPAMESWLQPMGGTMVGTFVQEAGDGAIQFTEILYLMEEGGTLVLRLKHFNADLTAWEAKDEMLTFRLVAIEPCAAYFHALTLRCADPNRPGEGLVAAVRMRSDNPEPQELVFRFDAASETGANACPDAMTTLDINECYASIVERADARRAKYLEAALNRHSDRTELVRKITASDAAFTAYRDAECDAVLEDWIEGSIRGLMYLSCKVALTDRRTHTIWQNWLTYADSTPPILPEPRSSR